MIARVATFTPGLLAMLRSRNDDGTPELRIRYTHAPSGPDPERFRVAESSDLRERLGLLLESRPIDRDALSVWENEVGMHQRCIVRLEHGSVELFAYDEDGLWLAEPDDSIDITRANGAELSATERQHVEAALAAHSVTPIL